VSVFGYDPVLLDVLRRRIRTSADELWAIRSDDPSAAVAIGLTRDIRRSLEQMWVPAITSVLFDDPLGASGTTSRSDTTGVPLLDVPGLDVPVLDVPVLDDAAWAERFDVLAERRLELVERLVWDPDDDAARSELAAIDRQIADEALEYLAGAPTGGHVRWFPTALLHASPLAAALVLARLAEMSGVLDDRTLAAVGALVLRRWRAGGTHGERWSDSFAGGDNTADVLFRMLVTRPDAATEFLRRTTPDELLLSAQFDDTVAALLLVGTDPARVDEATAGEVLRPLLEWSYDHELPPTLDGVTTTAPTILATALAPWLGALGPRARTWEWTYDDGDAALRWLVDDPDARAAMADALTAQQGALASASLIDADGRVNDVVLRDLSSTMAQVQIALRDAEIDDAAGRQLLAELSVTAAGIAIAAAVPGGSMALATDVGVSLLTPSAMSALDRWGVAPSAERTRSQAQATFGDRSVDTAVIAITGIIGALVDRGDLPESVFDGLDLGPTGDGRDGGGSCAPREASDRLHAFVAEIGPLTDPATHNALLAVLGAFANPLSDAQLCSGV
jgi:hypothetical protein